MPISKRQLLEATRLFEILSSGKDDAEAAEELGLDLDEFIAVKQRMFEYKSAEIRKMPVEHAFIEYLYHQLENIKDLTEILRVTSLDSRQSTASVSAVRARAEIWDKIFIKGQECGLIKKVAERSETLLGVVVANLTDEQLRTMMSKKLKEIGKIVEEYGDGDILSLPGPKNIYQDEPESGVVIDIRESANSPNIKSSAETSKKKKKKKKIEREKVMLDD